MKKWLLSAIELAQFLNVPVAEIPHLDASGQVPAPLTIDGKKVWRAAEIRDWLRAGGPPRSIWSWREAIRLRRKARLEGAVAASKHLRERARRAVEREGQRDE